MHIIFTPLSIPLLHRFAGKYGRSPRAHTRAQLFFLSRSLARLHACSLARPPACPPARPPWRCSAMLAGGRWRCQSAAACLQRLPLAAAGAGRGRWLLYVLLSSWLWALECVIWSLWCEAVTPPSSSTTATAAAAAPPRTDHPGQPECKTSFSGLVFQRLLGCTLP